MFLRRIMNRWCFLPRIKSRCCGTDYTSRSLGGCCSTQSTPPKSAPCSPTCWHAKVVVWPRTLLWRIGSDESCYRGMVKSQEIPGVLTTVWVECCVNWEYLMYRSWSSLLRLCKLKLLWRKGRARQNKLKYSCCNSMDSVHQINLRFSKKHGVALKTFSKWNANNNKTPNTTTWF